MKVLVTGGAGFVGSHIVDECLRKGHDVVVMDNLATGTRNNLNPEAKFLEMDITDPRLINVIREEGIEAIIHQAAQSTVPPSIKDPKFDADVNLSGTINLLQAVRELQLKKIVFAGSAASYGMPEYVPVDEKHPQRPMSFYGLSKKVIEEYFQMFHELFGTQYVVFRYANVYGPRQGQSGEGSVISIFTERMLTGKTCTIDGDGGATRDYIYVGDVARANVEALESDVNGIFNLSTEVEVSVNEVFQLLSEMIGYDQEPVHGPARIGDIYRSVLSNDKILASSLTWRPQMTLAEGLQATIAWGRSFYGADRS
ncbi:NAD-dependent epimerase/dehydratase family protein [Tumebacillus sp. ITR2]|uniref:NAD-dependent epimerase/dehydratase family protein n=1 Tax=Tumebacillus amylolyticus TaxID=2801339 RepID=A0ABS1J9Q9_9BACL|nr:NAD-dependent epimerase/dehydratase family protein [Tumebacillus amylolyticus]MBL0386955.1 NAD-dependent epimerase/dehydratase family protein [Tumebacillus amylolyticus]